MEWLLGAGPIMIPLLVCSVFSLAIIMERAINLRKNKILKPEIIQTIEAIKSPRDIPFAISKCEVIEGPFSNLLRRILSNNHLSREEKFIDIQAMGRQETRVLEKRLWLLEVITAIAPLLGLLGTVLGLEDIFAIISELGLGHAKAFAGGLAVAIRTTVFGLCIAIPSLVAYNYFDRKVDGYVREIEEYSLTILNKLYPPEV
ncbi:MotA/TolQ/ExbB proton channel family protein [Candidatus Kuenenia stuttgartiensis]|uniref:MotA/TolQ/ExbB proton channel family protein n=2 Tax=Candidatus Brocadiaceae TaxID=1127830 RepID=Q1PWB7_KUEST|nr:MULTISPECIES: MotA/TolQ/ExbB proton channel family protein [Kuenenia]MCZ7562443.1 MotA/TolQ/ExbB proton channel family protein [Burkholderiales bacterium]MBW7941092.1 MotA/TolQ/ExbB proton channel family protein [Candidatus Kuenenia stuttgartiensis]MCZ7622952.1 MotA/TolQ/ExbB proton channel family protein [Candidatus Kuenenia sp.]QII13994.1 MotA/TolQ/ExbB proton channel family protein [Candidatus Kuenenia stuttgartiensis]CAJ71525.1 similar to biopolymer transport ExbB peptide [Candidatus Ku